MDGRAAHAAGQRRPAHSGLRVILTIRITDAHRPCEAPFSFGNVTLHPVGLLSGVMTTAVG